MDIQLVGELLWRFIVAAFMSLVMALMLAALAWVFVRAVCFLGDMPVSYVALFIPAYLASFIWTFLSLSWE